VVSIAKNVLACHCTTCTYNKVIIDISSAVKGGSKLGIPSNSNVGLISFKITKIYVKRSSFLLGFSEKKHLNKMSFFLVHFIKNTLAATQCTTIFYALCYIVVMHGYISKQ